MAVNPTTITVNWRIRDPEFNDGEIKSTVDLEVSGPDRDGDVLVETVEGKMLFYADGPSLDRLIAELQARRAQQK